MNIEQRRRKLSPCLRDPVEQFPALWHLSMEQLQQMLSRSALVSLLLVRSLINNIGVRSPVARRWCMATLDIANGLGRICSFWALTEAMPKLIVDPLFTNSKNWEVARAQ